MDQTKSDPNLNSPSQSFQENIAKKFKFLTSVKNYLVSKLRPTKLDLFTSDSKDGISVISYDQHSFTEAEEQFDLQQSRLLKIDHASLQNLKTLLTTRYCDPTVRNQANLELLEIAEKTFARQLDIFERILKLINSKNNENDIMDKIQAQLQSGSLNEESVDAFVSSIVRNLVNELLKSAPRSQQKSIELLSETAPITENVLGDNVNVKKRDVSCECQQGGPSGAAVCWPRNF